MFEDAIKLVSQDKNKTGTSDEKYTELYGLKLELEAELSSLIENVKSSEGSGAMSEGSRRTARELDDSRERNRLRKE